MDKYTEETPDFTLKLILMTKRYHLVEIRKFGRLLNCEIWMDNIPFLTSIKNCNKNRRLTRQQAREIVKLLNKA